MSYFDKANTQVTRKSFGSKVDKEFKREGVIPLRDRKKEERDYVTEAANFAELNKQVNERKMNELKEAKEYDNKMKQGYSELKEYLIKDFISEICIEALLVDVEVVNDNMKNIVEMVNMQVEDLGGFNGIKQLAESSNNPILLNMISVCEETAKRVGERNLRESKGVAGKVNYSLNQIELDEYDYRKKEMGSEVIVNTIKDKVFQVVQDEQKMNADRQSVMDEIETKVSELQAPVEEAMQFIFESNGVEEDTLFDSIMRRQYKNLLETNSSPIFESFDYKENEEIIFEDNEFNMTDLDLYDEEIDDDEIAELFLEETANYSYVTNLEKNLESLYNELEYKVNKVRSKKDAKKQKEVINRIQESLENLENLDNGLFNAEEELTFESYMESIHRRMEYIRESDELIDSSMAKQSKDLASSGEKEMKAVAKGGKKVSEEVILCPKCGKEQCRCKVAKEDAEVINESIEKLTDLYNKLDDIIDHHDVAKNAVVESLTYDIDGDRTVVPFIQPKDLSLNNLEFAYKTRIVCESLKNSLKNVNYLQEANIIERFIELNLESIEESINIVDERHDMNHKVKILKNGALYLNKLQQVIDKSNFEFNDEILEESGVFNDMNDVDRVVNRVKEYVDLDNPNKDMMEMVMAEAIVEYTILETLNTLNLVKYTKEDVRQMARKNLNYVSEGLFKKKNKVSSYPEGDILNRLENL